MNESLVRSWRRSIGFTDQYQNYQDLVALNSNTDTYSLQDPVPIVLSIEFFVRDFHGFIIKMIDPSIEKLISYYVVA